MTQEGKQLLLEDLSTRLPYRVYISPVDCGKAILIGIKDGNLLLWDTIHKKEYDKPWDIEYTKPYLRPLSSMTEEESKEFESIWNSGFEKALDAQVSNCDNNVVRNLEIIASSKAIDWLNKKMFAYRTIDGKDMFELGLAIEALDGMYNIKEK